MTGTDDTKLHESSPLVLIVDDTRITADIERNFIVLSGFRVLVASSLQEVLDLVKEHAIDLIMIDVAFAKDKGLDVLSEARRLSCNSAMKALVTSMTSSNAVREKAEKSGADHFLVKPAPRQKVLKEIKALTSLAARDFERIKESLNVRLKLEDNTFRNAHSLDISEDGIHLGCDGVKPALGAAISMEISVESGLLNVSGSVVRHTTEGFGVRFDELTRTAKRALDKFILAHSMEAKASRYYL